MDNRRRLYIMIAGTDRNLYSLAYNCLIIFGVILSVIPLFWRENNAFILTCQLVGALIFIVDYLLQWITADQRFRRGWVSFVLFPFTPFALLSLAAIIASFGIGPRSLVLIRTFNIFRILRVFRIIRRSREYRLLAGALKKNARILLALLSFVLFYIFLVALVMFNAEPQNFPNFLDAIYWALVTLATIGYGDIVPLTVAGKVITVISSFVGVAIVALPTGFIAAAFMQELDHHNRR